MNFLKLFIKTHADKAEPGVAQHFSENLEIHWSRKVLSNCKITVINKVT